MLHTEAPQPTALSSRSPAVILAAACMASAGIVHAAAAGVHNEHGLLATMFAVTAFIQLGWAAIVMIKPTRGVFAVGVAIALGAIGFWAIAKVWGVGFVPGLVGPQPVDIQDAVAVALQVVAGMSALRALWHPASGGARTMVLSRVAVVVGALALIAAVPAAAAPHNGNHDHDAAADHEHDGMEHDENLAAVTLEGYTYHADVTDEQVAAAQQLIDDTKAALKETPYWDFDAALADGYVSIGDAVTGFEHVIHAGYIANGETLDPEQIESLVYQVQPNGQRVLVSAMYLMGFGTTMDDVPDIAGDITIWHDHQNLCWDENNPARVVATLDENGECPRGVFRGTQPMLHVWVADHRCGPFAGIEGSHGAACDHDDH